MSRLEGFEVSFEGFVDSIAAHFPSGHAWPRSPSAVFMAVVRGIARNHAELQDFTMATVQQWQPYTTTLRLGEWEQACGLPDLCLGYGQTFQERRSMLLRTLAGPDLPYVDSSPAAIAVIESVCADIGFPATVRYNTPLRVGRDRIGSRLGALNGRLYVFVDEVLPIFRVGRRVGDRLVIGTNRANQLECHLRRIAPARFQINVIFN